MHLIYLVFPTVHGLILFFIFLFSSCSLFIHVCPLSLQLLFYILLFILCSLPSPVPSSSSSSSVSRPAHLCLETFN